MSTKATALLIFFLSLWSFASQAPQAVFDDQIVTRTALAVQIVDNGSVEITRFADWTIDKATIDGHAYADKTPGHSFLALPAVAIDKLVRTLLGQITDSRNTTLFADYAKWETLSVNCLISAIATAVLFLAALHLGASRAGALFAAFSLSLATPFFGWSTAFFAHSVTGSMLLFGLAGILLLFDGERRVPAGPAVLLGGLLGYTCVVDLTALPAVAVLGLFALVRAARAAQLPRVTLLLGGGGIVGLLPLLVYNQLAFGSPLHLGYANTDFNGMSQGFFGVTWPNPVVLVQLLVGPYRGLLPLSPILLLVPAGLAVLIRDPARRGAGIAIALIVVLYFWINSSYYYWNGGYSTGPRHLVAMLPLAALGLAFAWPAARLERAGTLVLLAISLFMSLACALAGMFAPESIFNPLVDWILRRALEPRFAVAGLAIVPVWVTFAVLLYQADRRQAAPARTGSAAGHPTLAQ